MDASARVHRTIKAISAIAIIGPIAIYLILHFIFRVSDLWSLSAGAVLAAAANLYDAIRRGRLNGLAVLVLIELAISVALILVTHNPRVLLFRPAVLLAIAGLYLLFTCVSGQPVAFEPALSALSHGDASIAQAFERTWSTSSELRLRLRIMTAGWGVAFLIDAFIRSYLAARSSITKAFLEPHIISVVLIAAAIGLAAVQFRSIKRIMGQP